MKPLLTTAVISVIITISATSCYVVQSSTQPSVYQETYQQEALEISFSTFYDELSPYGRWIDYPQYGRVWIASQSVFSPYQTDGHWAYTTYGWTWVSDYNWGWAPFHYGRWLYDSFYGWLWIPGYEWAPAWVSWRSGGGYYGWAPLSPGISIGVDIGFNTIPQNYWCFVPNQYMGSTNMRNYYTSRNNNIYIINNTTIINATNQYRGARYWQGPDRRDVERNTGRPLQAYELRDANRPGEQMNNNNINVYRPRIKQNDMERRTPGFSDNKPRQGQLPTNATPHRDVPNNNGNNMPPSKPYTPPSNTPAIPERQKPPTQQPVNTLPTGTTKPMPSTPQPQPSQPVNNVPVTRTPRVPQNQDGSPFPTKPMPSTPQPQPSQPVNNVPVTKPPRVPQSPDERPKTDKPAQPSVPPKQDNKPQPQRSHRVFKPQVN